MKIAMIGQKGIPTQYGGIERHVEEMARELTGQGHEVWVYARDWYTPPTITEYHGIKIIHTWTIHTKNLDAIVHTFTSTLHTIRHRPDVIHYHGVGPALLSWLPRVFLPSARVIVTIHSLDRFQQKWSFFAKLALRLGEWAACRFPHKTIVVSKLLQDYCWDKFRRETTYIPNGVAIVCSAPLLLSQWQLKPFRYLLMVARLIPDKGAHYLIDAWNKARELAPDLFKDYRLVIAGGGQQTERYVKKLHAMAKGDDSVVFTGWVKGRVLDELYANTALFIHPSEIEGLPIAVLEAMACGRPALVSDIPAHRELIVDDRFWFASTDADELAAKIVDLLQRPELLTEAGSENKVRVEELYNWEKVAKKAEEVYEK